MYFFRLLPNFDSNFCSAPYGETPGIAEAIDHVFIFALPKFAQSSRRDCLDAFQAFVKMGFKLLQRSRLDVFVFCIFLIFVMLVA